MGYFLLEDQQALRANPFHMVAASVLQERGVAGGTPRAVKILDAERL
jgi:hypothetical protein